MSGPSPSQSSALDEMSSGRNGTSSSSFTSVPAADPERVREQLYHMASSMVDNIFAKAIVRASQQLAFGHTQQQHHHHHPYQRPQARSMSICNSIELIDRTTPTYSSGYHYSRPQHRSHSIQLQKPPTVSSFHKQASVGSAAPSTSAAKVSATGHNVANTNTSTTAAAATVTNTRQPQSQFPLGCIEEYESTDAAVEVVETRANMAPTTSSQSSINEKSGNIRDIRSRQAPPPTTLVLDDGSGNPPEIQIDYAGPRTPSPIEESKFELKFTMKQYKFKVDFDQESIMEVDEEDDEEADRYKQFQAEKAEVNVTVNPLANQRPVPTVSIMTPTKSMAQANSAQFDVANSPELDVDITQAQQISKHIVADVIQQARDKLTNDMHGQMKREGESFSRISCRSGQTDAGGNCVWLWRVRDTLGRLMRSACFCGQPNKDETTTTTATGTSTNNAGGGGGGYGNGQSRESFV